MRKPKIQQIDYRNGIHRGVLTEIARERGVTRQAIQKSMKKGNPGILERIAEIIEERKARQKGGKNHE
jgi:predicted DNA-binding protein YlxM (UPF0122 family)